MIVHASIPDYLMRQAAEVAERENTIFGNESIPGIRKEEELEIA